MLAVLWLTVPTDTPGVDPSPDATMGWLRDTTPVSIEQDGRFEIGSYDPSRPLIIDQTILWNTFLGGTSADQAYGIAVDKNGNLYISGVSYTTWGSPISDHAGGLFDAFVAKLNSSGNLVWNTFLGGTGRDCSYAIALDKSGNVYIAGYSDAAWGAPVRAYAGDYDAFAAKLNGSGDLVWNTFLGSSDEQNLNKGDIGHSVAVDMSGNVYVAGYSWDTWGSPIRDFTDFRDAFTAKLDSSGNLSWNTFLGSGGDDYGRGIAVDESGNSYPAGKSCGSWGSPVREHAGWCDGFVAKLDDSGNLAWNTFLGSGGDDSARGIVLDNTGDVYLVGFSSHEWGTPVRAYDDEDDVFAARLDKEGKLIWHTFLGGSENDYGYGITVDGSENAYVVGYSRDTWETPSRPFSNAPDAFAVGLDSNGKLTWNTFLGGNKSDYGYAIAVDGGGDLYVTGTSFSEWESPIHRYTDAGDAFVVKLVVADTKKIFLPLIVH